MTCLFTLLKDNWLGECLADLVLLKFVQCAHCFSFARKGINYKDRVNCGPECCPNFLCSQRKSPGPLGSYALSTSVLEEWNEMLVFYFVDVLILRIKKHVESISFIKKETHFLKETILIWFNVNSVKIKCLKWSVFKPLLYSFVNLKRKWN